MNTALRSRMVGSSMPAASIGAGEYASVLRNENAAVRALSQIVEDESGSLNRFLHVALKSCSAGTAGITLLQQTAPGESSLRWLAIAGALSGHQGFAPPPSFSYCGMCLDHGQPLLLTQPQRTFPYLGALRPLIAEVLVAPIHEGREQLGTLWMAQHDPQRGFCAEDAVMVQRLALHLAWALKRSRHELEHQRVIAYRDAQLRDAHHRVKNTLQIAASTLQLEASTTSSDSARKALQSGIGRLRVLAKVHELLDRETGGEQIAVHTLLQSVVDGARHSFVEVSSRVDLKLAAAAIWLPADQAIPLALLANEAITNACKHAYPGDQSGEICIELNRDSNGVLVLRIADDGVGMGKQRIKGLGLQLIAGFSEQLQGAIRFIEPPGASGTTVVLTMLPKARNE